MEIPVYLFVGFLESGKTKFIQETLEDSRFNKGEKTLLLLCEEGMKEYEPSRFLFGDVFVHRVEEESDLTPKLYKELLKQHKFTRVIVEYNGMWMLRALFESMPQNWLIYQAFLFADANTFASYNANMRSLVVDKINVCELVVFNRTDEKTDRLALHKIVRGISRRIDIAFEKRDGSVDYDEIVDPLPFNLNADVMEIEDRDFAIWYRDLSEDLEKYEGKTIRFKALVEKSPRLPSYCMIVGRDVMTCCVNDIAYSGLVCRWGDSGLYRKGDWVTVTGKVQLMQKSSGKGPVPVILADVETSADAPEQPVATFY